jgi:hypothetical protein
MATTNIELDIENITGVSDADDQFVKSAQKFVVSSIPKELLLWAGTSTAVASHGGDSSPTAITIPQPTDNIIDVQRNGYSAEQVSESLQGFIANSSSLHYATEIFPKYYIQAGNKIIVKPDPSDSETALVNYVDFLKIDDDCDLRNAVIFHAASKEFTKLATSKLLDWTDVAAPVPLSNPSFGTDLSISSVSPNVPTLSSNSVSFSTTAPTYSAPVLEARKAFSSYSSGLSETDPGTFGIVSSPPAVPSAPSYTTPAISSVNISNVGVPPSYTPPVVASDSAGVELTALTQLDAQNTIDDFDGNAIEFDQWFATAAHLIEDEEDTELASIQIQKISAYVNAYSQAMQNQLNEFNESNAEYQAKLQEAIQQAQINAQEAQQESNLLLQQENQEFAASLQRYSAQVQSYQTVVSKEVQEYQQKLAQYQLELSTSVQAWQNEESHKLSIHQSNLQDSLNTFNKENAEYQAQLQVSIQNAQLSSQDDAQNLQKYSTELQAYKDDVEKQVHNYTNSLQKNIKEYESKLALYNSNVQKYASEVGEIVQKSTLATQNAAYYSKEAEKYYNWAKLEVNSYVQNNSKMIRQTMAAQAAQQRA